MSGKWTHAICDECWEKKEPDREPTRLVEEFRHKEPCCYCGKSQKSGIFVRGDPTITPCNGKGIVHNE